MRARLIAVLVPLLVLAMAAVGTATAAPGGGEADHSRVIVVLENGSDARAVAADAARDHRAKINYVYEHALQAFAAHVPSGRLRALRSDPRVVSVRPDARVSIQAQTMPTGVDRIFEPDVRNVEDGIPRLGIDGRDDQRVDVDVAVLDTGIDFEHPDLNVFGGVDCTVSSGGGPPWARTYECSSTQGTGGDDDHYHGTHVAGTVGALDNGDGVVGVAPGARLWAVKVLDSSGSGYTSGILKGIDWVVQQGDIEVLNMSLGGSGNCGDYGDFLTAAVDSGIAVAVAAGNSDMDTRDFAPANCDDAFAVSALADFDGLSGGLDNSGCRTDQDDTLADFSNWGPKVGIAAPGVCILSTYPVERGSYASISGTSMASPHVAGAFALLASNDPNTASKGRAAVEGYIDTLTTSGNFHWSDDSGDGEGNKERLLDISTLTPKLVPTDNLAPTASFEDACIDLTCEFNGSSSSDADGTIGSYDWNVDGAKYTDQTIAHTFAAGGTYTVSLTVTDDDGATDTATREITVSVASDGGGESTSSITLDVVASKSKGEQIATLTWRSAAGVEVNVYRDSVLVTTTENDGEFEHSSGQKGGGSATYVVCETAEPTPACSRDVTVTW